MKQALGPKVRDEDIMSLVRKDVTAKYRPPSSDWRDSEAQKQAKIDKKIQETFVRMKKSSKLNKLLSEQIQNIS